MLWPILLAIWLILWVLLSISNFNFDGSKIVMGLLAAAVAVCILFERYKGRT